MAGDVDGQVAIVTGAASGIGRAAAPIFVREGARVALADVNEEAGRAVAAEIEAAGGEAMFVRCDVSQEADVAQLVEKTVERFGRLDCAFNNAGAGEAPKPLAEQESAVWERMFRINQLSVFLCMKHQVAAMLKTGGGAIVNNASNSAVVGLGGLTPYSSSKGGVVAASRSAAVEFAPQGIRINAICPGLVGVKQTRDRDWAKELGIPIGRPGECDEIGEVVVFLCSPRASYLVGQTISIDGGQTAK